MATVAGRELILFGGGDGVCYAFEALQNVPDEPVSLKKVWSYEGNPDTYKYDNGELINFYRGDKRKSSSLNKNDGKYFGPNQIIATPVYHEGRVYVAMGQDPAHGRGKGLLHCIDASGKGDITKYVGSVFQPVGNDIIAIGYEINFNRYFYEYTPPRQLEEIETDLKRIEGEIADMLAQVTE